MKLRLTAVAALAALAAAVAAQPAAADGPDELFARYQPVAVLDQAELFAPTSVEDFLADATLKQLSGGAFGPAEMPEAGLPVHGEGWRLDHRCQAIAGPFALACYTPASQGPRVVYGRYEVYGGTTVLQYWFFYEHNFWSFPGLPFGAVWQAHEGDWEVVTIVLDDKQTPVEVAYSQHCTGERRAWDDVSKLAGTSRPIVYVARGSHANLFEPGLHLISRACYPPQALAFFDAIGIPPRDVTVPGLVLSSIPLERVHDWSPRWLRFPGTWGEAQYVGAPPPVGIVEFGTSPVGPAFQDDWLDPLATIATYGTG